MLMLGTFLAWKHSVELGVESADMAAVVGGFLLAGEEDVEEEMDVVLVVIESAECEAERLLPSCDRLRMADSGAMLTSLARPLRCLRSPPLDDPEEEVGPFPPFGLNWSLAVETWCRSVASTLSKS